MISSGFSHSQVTSEPNKIKRIQCVAIFSAIRTKIPKKTKNVGLNIGALPTIWGQYNRITLRRKWLNFLKEMWFISVPGAGMNAIDHRAIVTMKRSGLDLVAYETALNEFCNVMHESIFCNSLQIANVFFSNELEVENNDEIKSHSLTDLILDPHCKIFHFEIINITNIIFYYYYYCKYMQVIYQELKNSFSIKNRQDKYRSRKKNEYHQATPYDLRLDYLKRKNNGIIVSSCPEFSDCDRIATVFHKNSKDSLIKRHENLELNINKRIRKAK
jgi:hypothetical protein